MCSLKCTINILFNLQVNYDHDMLLGGDIDRTVRAPHTNVPITIQDIQGGPRPAAVLDNKYRKVHFKVCALIYNII